VLNGFISEVGLVKGMDRSFSCTDLATTGAGPQALTAGSRGRGIPGQRSLQGLSSSLGALARPSRRNMPKRSGSVAALTDSKSQPCLMAPALLALARGDAAPRVLPQRRAPPGVGATGARAELSQGYSSSIGIARRVR
ncbi:unnamed protein product, partial [Polarella glacialis]